MPFNLKLQLFETPSVLLKETHCFYMFSKHKGKHFFFFPYFFNKNTNLYPATLLKERARMHVFFDEFWETSHLFYRTIPEDCFCSTEKYFTNEIVKKPLKNEKKHENYRYENNYIRRKKLKHNLYEVFIFPYFSVFRWYTEGTCF